MKFRRVTRSDMAHTVTVRIFQNGNGQEALLVPAQTMEGFRPGAETGSASTQGTTCPVPEALDRAKAMLGVKPGLLEVVVQLADGARWDPAWGELI
ncbi:MAG: hypothetical protein ACTHLC_15555 [Rhizobiaceae bacterium]